MRFDPERHHRRSIRLKGYDYSQPGAYFVTVCTKDRACVFGEVLNGGMRLNAYGEIAQACWEAISNHFRHVELDKFVVMPNHVHGILWIVRRVGAHAVGARHAVPLRGIVPHTPLSRSSWERFGNPVAGSIPTVIRSFKSAVTKRVNELRGTPGIAVWQRNYYEHIIRNEESLNRIREYILTNPMRWMLDRENPHRDGTDEFDQWLDRFGNKSNRGTNAR